MRSTDIRKVEKAISHRLGLLTQITAKQEEMFQNLEKDVIHALKTNEILQNKCQLYTQINSLLSQTIQDHLEIKSNEHSQSSDAERAFQREIRNYSDHSLQQKAKVDELTHKANKILSMKKKQKAKSSQSLSQESMIRIGPMIEEQVSMLNECRDRVQQLKDRLKSQSTGTGNPSGPSGHGQSAQSAEAQRSNPKSFLISAPQ